MNDISIILICLITFPFILFILRIIILSWKYFLQMRQLKAMEQMSSRQHSDNAANTNTVNSDTTCQMEAGAKVADCPPAYDDIVQPPLDVKQPCQEVATGSTANQSSNAISTITIDTNIPSNVANTMASENSKDPSIV